MLDNEFQQNKDAKIIKMHPITLYNLSLELAKEQAVLSMDYYNGIPVEADMDLEKDIFCFE